ncbi:type II secretion system protein GspD [Gemmobacter tilapiae]|uniref:Type II secretion system protein GspD n=2 Tax=Neogemmobacter tilapiae TaxID=875041 RepID=A0A918WQT0_9RHOB|nr:type II secretion system protein GspD [Gemmobacter tilapiae]
MQRGTDNFLNGDALRGRGKSQAIVVPSDGEKVELALVNASIEAAAKAVLGDTLQQNYVVADGLEGSITIQTTGPVPKSALLDLFEASLAANGAQLRNEGGILRIVGGTSGNTTFRVAGTGGVDGSSIVVAPLRFISGSEMAKLLEPLTLQGLNVVVEKERNLLLLSGSGPLLESALDALNLFDVDVLQGKSVALVQLRSAEPEALVSELTKIFEAEEGGMLNGVVEFIPNPRLKSILVVSSRSIYVDRAQRWIRELDKSAAGSSVYMATYPLQNRSASEVAPILNSMMAESGSSSSGGKEEVTLAAMSEGGASGGGSGGARVAADDSRNALIVRGTREDHDQVAYLLSSLDSAARQVLLEATIAEVVLKDELSVGTRWFLSRGNWDLNFGPAARKGHQGGNGFSAVFGVGGADMALTALASVTEVKIISAPTLMVLDNKEGILQIGDQVPIATQSEVSADSANAPVLTQVDYRDTGIILRVKPRIGNGGKVLLDITQEVSAVKTTETTGGIASPTISQRKIQTSVSLGDGQTLALGGLVQEQDDSGSTETPGLGKVPVVGNLFKSKDSSKTRTELLILIRPRVVEDDGDAADATAYWRNKLSQSDTLLDTGLGPARHTIADITQ